MLIKIGSKLFNFWIFAGPALSMAVLNNNIIKKEQKALESMVDFVKENKDCKIVKTQHKLPAYPFFKYYEHHVVNENGKSVDMHGSHAPSNMAMK